MAERQPGDKMTREQRDQKQREAWIMRQRGDTQEQIAEALGVDHSTISRMLKVTSARLAKEFSADAQSMIAEQVGQLDYIINRALSAFRASTCEETGKSGDARLLQAATAAIAQKAKLLGTEAPKKTEISGPGGKPVAIAGADLVVAEKQLQEWRQKMQAEIGQLSLSGPPE